jgi:hypothetical protein
MISIFIKSKNELVCKALLNLEEDSMGVLEGQFMPLEGYEPIKKLIKEYSNLILELSITETKKNNIFLELQKEIEKLYLRAYNDKNEELDFSHIELRDYSDELGCEGFNILLYK